MLESIELFQKAIERVLQLLTVRAENKRRLFTEVVEPLFRELEPVVDDYMATLAACRRELQSAPDAAQSRAVLEALRDQLRVRRMKVRGYAQRLVDEATDEDLKKFARHVCGIFDSPDIPKPKAGMSDLGAVVEDLPQTDATRRARIADKLQSITWRVEENWMAAASLYAYFRMKSFA